MSIRTVGVLCDTSMVHVFVLVALPGLALKDVDGRGVGCGGCCAVVMMLLFEQAPVTADGRMVGVGTACRHTPTSVAVEWVSSSDTSRRTLGSPTTIHSE